MYRKTLLDNSIRIVTERLPSRLVSVGIWVDVGSRDEDQSNNGSAHFAEVLQLELKRIFLVPNGRHDQAASR